MAIKILAITSNRTTPSGRIYVGGEGGPSTLVQKYSAEFNMYRCQINPYNNDQMVVIGINRAWFSVDGGETWDTSVYVGNDGVPRTLVWFDDSSFWFATESTPVDLPARVFRSLDAGVTITNIPFTFLGDTGKVADMGFIPGGYGYLLENEIGGQDILHYTLDGGNSWTPLLLEALGTTPNFLSTFLEGSGAEASRRIFPVEFSGSQWFYLLTSHKVYRIDHAPDFSTSTVQLVWEYNPVVESTFPATIGSTLTGYVLGEDYNTRFDDIKVRVGSSRFWLGGKFALRAHSFDGVNFFITDNNHAVFDDDEFFTHTPLDANRVFAGSSQPETSLFPFRPGLNFSQNGGISISPYLVFPGDNVLFHHDAIDDPPVIGCSQPLACNYGEDVTRDDGSCLNAVKLTNCLTNEEIHTDNQDIVALACRPPRVAIEVQSLEPGVENQSLTLFINGVLAFVYTAAVPIIILPIDRIETFIEEMIAWINSNTSFRAERIDPASNPITPGSSNSIWIFGNTPQSGLPASILQEGLLGAAVQNNFDTGSSGSVVRVFEYEGCWIVCGQGDCALAEFVTLTASYPSCYTCSIEPAGRICLDCSAQVYVGPVALRPNGSSKNPNCVAVGDTVNIHLRTSFPPRTYGFIPLLETPDCGNCPITIIMSGDKTAFFPEGSTFSLQPGPGTYTVATVDYDSIGDITRIVTVENCEEGAEYDSAVPFQDCNCQSIVLIERWNGETFENVFSESYPCEELQVNQDLQYLIEDTGTYRIRTVHVDCAEVRECIFWFKACEQFTVKSVGCHEYSITPEGDWANELPDETPVSISIRNLISGELILEEDTTFASIPFLFIYDKDTIYEVSVSIDGGEPWKSLVVDICDLLACESALTRRLFCEEDLCDQPDSANNQLVRQELNRISLLKSSIEAEVFSDRHRWTGVPKYIEEKKASIAPLISLIKYSYTLTDRCGECDDKAQPCKDC